MVADHLVYCSRLPSWLLQGSCLLSGWAVQDTAKTSDEPCHQHHAQHSLTVCLHQRKFQLTGLETFKIFVTIPTHVDEEEEERVAAMLLPL